MQKSGEKKIRQGNDMIADGTRAIAARKADYRQAVQETGLAVSSKQLREEIKSLRQVAEKWEAAEERISKGEKSVRQGEKQLAEAREASRKGDKLIAQGRDQMQAAEVQYLTGTDETGTSGNR